MWVLSRNATLEAFKDAAEVNRTLTSNKLNHTLLSRDEVTCGGVPAIHSLFLLTLLSFISSLI